MVRLGPQGPQDQLDRQDPGAHQGTLQAYQAQTALPALRVHLDLPEDLVKLALRDHLETLGHQVHPDQEEIKENKGQLVQQDRQDREGLLGLQVPLDHQEVLVLKEIEDHADQLGLLVRLVHPDHQVIQDRRENLVQPGLQEKQEDLESLVTVVLLDQ